MKPSSLAGRSSASSAASCSTVNGAVTISHGRSRPGASGAAIAMLAPERSRRRRTPPTTSTSVPKSRATSSSDSRRERPGRCGRPRGGGGAGRPRAPGTGSRGSRERRRALPGRPAPPRAPRLRSAAIVMSSTKEATGAPCASDTSHAGVRCQKWPIPGTSEGSESVWKTRRAAPPEARATRRASAPRSTPGGAISSISTPMRRRSGGSSGSRHRHRHRHRQRQRQRRRHRHVAAGRRRHGAAQGTTGRLSPASSAAPARASASRTEPLCQIAASSVAFASV